MKDCTSVSEAMPSIEEQTNLDRWKVGAVIESNREGNVKSMKSGGGKEVIQGHSSKASSRSSVS